jgi:hypothetical protein
MSKLETNELSFSQLAGMSRAELDALWHKIRQELEKEDPETLTPDEKNYLILAIFYTTKQE